MRRLAIAIPLALALAPAAQAAEVHTSRACYHQATEVVGGHKVERQPTVAVTGSGFPAQQAYNVLLDGVPLPGPDVETDEAGTMTGSFSPPLLGPRQDERTFRLTVVAGDQTATTTFGVTRFLVRFGGRGDPAKLRVRFAVFGFALDAANPSPDVYVHWITPRGRWKATAKLGHAHGLCGALRSSRRALFPFRPTQSGLWRLQFDTRRRFERGTTRSPFLFYTAGVTVDLGRKPAGARA